MFGFSLAEVGVIFLVALLVLGPEKLPEFARNFGKIMNTLKRQTDGLRREWYNAVYIPAQETRKIVEESQRNLRAIGAEAKQELLNVEEEIKNQNPTLPNTLDQTNTEPAIGTQTANSAQTTKADVSLKQDVEGNS